MAISDTKPKKSNEKPQNTCADPKSGKDPLCLVLRHLRLNLLTSDQKESLRTHLLVITVRNALLMLFVEFAVLGSLMLVGRIILERNFSDTVEQTAGIARTFSGNNQEIRDINDELLKIRRIHDEFVPAGDIYAMLVADIPSNVSLNSLEIDFIGKSVHLLGVARSRDDLNKLREALIGNRAIQNLQSPLSNLFVKNDIPFEFSADLKAENATTTSFDGSAIAPTYATSTATSTLAI
jgi:hypothetical protein